MKPLLLGGVLDNVYDDYERPILFYFARTLKAEKRDSCVMEVWVL